MKLFHSPPSPFVRKVMIFAIETGLDDRIELIATKARADQDEALARANPIGKIPALVTDDGLVLCDSPLICEHLDSLHDGAKLIPPEGPERWKVLNIAAVVDDFLDGATARNRERRLPADEQRQDYLEKERVRMGRCLDFLEARIDELGDAFTLAHIAIGVALGYADFRHAQDKWRATRPRLAAWYAEFSRRLSMQATTPPET